MRKVRLLCVVILILLTVVGVSAQRKGRPQPAAVCGDPTVRCPTSIEFQPYQLPFRIPPNAVIWETEKFYAVILKSIRDDSKGGNCDIFVPEAEREAAQALFPRNKVFGSRCMEPGDLFYTDVSEGSQFIAVYAGRTRAEGVAMLSKVKATGKFPGANLRRMSAGFNGT